MMGIAIGLLALSPVLPSPAMRRSLMRCEVKLTQKAIGSSRYFGSGIYTIAFLREGPDLDRWSAWGHLDASVHRTQDNPFPVQAAKTGHRTQLSWNIHESRVNGTFDWSSDEHTDGQIRLMVTGHPQIDAPYSVLGKCAVDRKFSSADGSGSIQ